MTEREPCLYSRAPLAVPRLLLAVPRSLLSFPPPFWSSRLPPLSFPQFLAGIHGWDLRRRQNKQNPGFPIKDVGNDRSRERRGGAGFSVLKNPSSASTPPRAETPTSHRPPRSPALTPRRAGTQGDCTTRPVYVKDSHVLVTVDVRPSSPMIPTYTAILQPVRASSRRRGEACPAGRRARERSECPMPRRSEPHNTMSGSGHVPPRNDRVRVPTKAPRNFEGGGGGYAQ